MSAASWIPPTCRSTSSRETLQQNRQLKAIAKRVEKKITADLEDMRDNDREAYEKFFENFGRGLKYGIYSSYGMKADELADLLLFWSAKEQKMITLAEYAKGMPEDQKAIYYAAGDSRERLAKMPVVKGVLDRGYDVLLLTQDVDEFTFQAMREYVAADMPKIYEDDAAREAAEKAVADGAEPEVEDRHLELKNVATGDLDLATEDEKKEAEDATKENEDLFSAMKEALGDKVEKVAVSARLTDAPACITTEGPLSLEMEKVLQKGPEGAPDGMPKSQRVLELNAKHPVFAKLVAAQKAGDADKIKQYSGLLYDQAPAGRGHPPRGPRGLCGGCLQLDVVGSLRGFTKPRNSSTLKPRQSGNLPFNFGDMTRRSMPPRFKAPLLALAGFRCLRQNIDVTVVQTSRWGRP